MTSRRQHKKSNKLSLPQLDNCKTRKDTKNCITKQVPNTKKPHKQWEQRFTMNKQQQKSKTLKFILSIVLIQHRKIPGMTEELLTGTSIINSNNFYYSRSLLYIEMIQTVAPDSDPMTACQIVNHETAALVFQEWHCLNLLVFFREMILVNSVLFVFITRFGTFWLL